MSAPVKIDLRDFLWRKMESDGTPTRDDSRTYLPWLIAIMVFLAALSIAAAVVAATATSRWAGELAGTVTVEIAPRAATDPRSAADRLATVLDIVRATPGSRAPSRSAASISPSCWSRGWARQRCSTICRCRR